MLWNWIAFYVALANPFRIIGKNRERSLNLLALNLVVLVDCDLNDRRVGCVRDDVRKVSIIFHSNSRINRAVVVAEGGGPIGELGLEFFLCFRHKLVEIRGPNKLIGGAKCDSKAVLLHKIILNN